MADGAITTPPRVAACPLTWQPGSDILAAMADALATVGAVDLVLFPAGTGVAASEGAGDDAAATEKFLAAVANLARQHQLWLCPGSWINDQGRHVTGLFNPDGDLVTTQAQTHLAPGETFKPSNDLVLVETPFGLTGFLLGHDAWVPEVCRILARRGVALLLAPVHSREPYTEWDQIAGTWAQVQQNQVFAAEAGWIGPGHGGRPAVMAPCEMTTGLTGYLSRPETGPAVAALDEVARLGVKQQYDILGLQNPGLYRRYLPALYRRPAAGSGYPGGDS